MIPISLSALAYLREAERAKKLERLAEADYERPTARRMRSIHHWAQDMARRAEG